MAFGSVFSDNDPTTASIEQTMGVLFWGTNLLALIESIEA